MSYPCAVSRKQEQITCRSAPACWRRLPASGRGGRSLAPFNQPQSPQLKTCAEGLELLAEAPKVTIIIIAQREMMNNEHIPLLLDAKSLT